MQIEESTQAKLFPELRAWLKRTGTTQSDLARLLDVSDAQVSRFLNGSRSLSPEPAIKLALLTDIPVEKLLVDGRAAKLLKLLARQVNYGMQNPKKNRNVR
jgi:transcriptional regulator with XRE-family HTH domain